MSRLSSTRGLLALCLLVLTPVAAPAQRPLDHDAYDRWRTIGQEGLSRDGRWVSYLLEPQQGDAELVIRSVAGSTEYRVPRGRDARFSPAGGHVVFMIKPAYTEVRAARIARRSAQDMPRDSLGIMTLATGEITRVERVQSFRAPERGSSWVAYHLERPKAPAGARDTARTDSAGPRPKRDNEIGSPLVLRDLASGAERRFEDVMEYAFAREGNLLALTLSSRSGDADGVLVVSLQGEVADRRVAGGRGSYKSLAFTEAGDQVAFLSNREEAAAEHPRFALYRWRARDDSARAVAHAGAAGMRDGWTVSEHRLPSFSRSGGRLFFGAASWEAPAPADSTPENEQVKVDIWHWEDAELQPQQLRRVEQTRRRNHLAVVDLDGGRLLQLADAELADIGLPEGGEGRYALGETTAPYALRSSWDTPGWRDVYLISLETGERTRIAEQTRANPSISPGGHFAYWYDHESGAGYTYRFADGTTAKVTGGIGVPLTDEEHDSPSLPPQHGLAGWTEGDRELLLYDRYDLWAVDPSGARAPRNLTEGVGRRDSVRFRLVDLDRERQAIATDRPLLLSAFDYRSKAAGFFRDRVTGAAEPERLLWMDRRFGTPSKAEEADVMLFTRESVREFPDLWTSGLDFARPARLSEANPQQAEYRWVTVEPVQWRGANGTPLAGLLYKPENFDPARKYPMIVNSYERNSDNLHAHSPVIPHRSTIRPSFYASRGYLVFIPDIVYRVGYPGQGALDAVVPGVMALIDRGFVDPARIGLQGHSWGGYQIAYMVTKTNLFAAGAPGAPVANMTSAYGGIRWESGLSRMFQYERTQSRIGATLWEAPLRYLENSPLFWVDRIETPLLILHNDNDGAVPWYQGIELFTAMRRLGKPAWMVNYNGEPHWPLPYPKRRDWNIRMQQFFDHYLMGAAMPVWMAQGVPAVDKGRTMGLELVEPGAECPKPGGEPEPGPLSGVTCPVRK